MSMTEAGSADSWTMSRLKTTACAHAGPGSVLGGVAWHHLFQRVGIQGSEQPLFRQHCHWRALFGIEGVCRRALAFLNDLVGQLRAAALADIDLDAGRLGKGFHQGSRCLGMLTVVQRKRLRIGCMRKADRRGAEQRACAEHQSIAQQSAPSVICHGNGSGGS
jgi:hypothetical protein